MKIALIAGITGMDGSHLAELLLEKEYSSEIFNKNKFNKINGGYYK